MRHGVFNTIMFSVALAIVVVWQCFDSASATANNKVLGSNLTEFVVTQNLNVETVTCTDYFAHYDLNQYGSIEGSGCASTGLLLTANGNGGHVNISFAMSAGGKFTAQGCQVDSTVLMPGYYKVAINCINF